MPSPLVRQDPVSERPDRTAAPRGSRTGTRQPPTRQPPAALPLWLLAPTLAAALLGQTGCSNPADDPDQGQAAQDAGPGSSTCPWMRVQPSGQCCPKGQFYGFAADGCVPVGPPECAETVLATPETCVPRWCEVWRLAAGNACEPPQTGCEAVATTCAAGQEFGPTSCPAGQWRPTPSGACIPAGLIAEAALPEPSSPAMAPPAAPTTAPLPPLADTRFCRDEKAGVTALCRATEGPCAAGQMPDPDAPEGCIAVGVPWICPDGFEVDAKAPVVEGALPPCVPSLAACPEDPFGGLQDGPTHLFVAAKAPAGGDGSRAKPFSSIGAAVAVAAEGSTIAVGAGTYKESVVLTKPMTLQGRCAAMVEVQPAQDQQALQLFGGSSAAKVRVRGLTARGGRLTVGVGKGANVEIEHLWVVDGAVLGLHATGKLTQALVSRSVVADTVPHGLNGGMGVGANGGAHLTLQEVRVHRNAGAGLVAEEAGTRITGSAVRCDDTRPDATKSHGIGALTQSGAVIALRSARLHGNRLAGVAAQLAGAHAQLVATLIDGTRAQEKDGTRGVGVLVQSGASAQLVGVRISDNQTAGVLVTLAGAKLEATALIVDGTRPQPVDGVNGVGVAAQVGASLTLRDVRLSDNRQAGLDVSGAGTLVQASRVLVASTLPSDDNPASGVNVTTGARLALQGARVSGSVGYGLSVVSAASVIEATDVLIDQTEGRALDGRLGYGAVAAIGGHLRLTGVRISRSAAAGLVVSDGARVTARGLLVDRGRGRLLDGYWGVGAVLQKSGEIDLQGSRLWKNRMAGVIARGSSKAALVGVRIDQTEKEAISGHLGVGALFVQEGQAVALRSCLLLANHSAAVGFNRAGGVVDGCVGADTAGADYPELGEDGKFLETKVTLADGLYADRSASVEIRRSVFARQARAGLLLAHCAKAEVRQSIASGGLYGIVTLGAGDMDTQDNALLSNGQNRVGGELMTLPPAPDLSTL